MATLPPKFDVLIPKPKKQLSCQTLLHDGVISNHGYIRKEPEDRSLKRLGELVRMKWSRKYVVLSAGCMYIYGSEKSDRYERASSLFGYDRIEPDQDAAGLTWVFRLTNELDDRPKILRFSASSEDERNNWIESFTKEILTGNSSLLKLSGGTMQAIGRSVGFQTMSGLAKKKIRETILQDKDDLEYVDMQDVYDDIKDVTNTLPLVSASNGVKRSVSCPSEDDEEENCIYDDVSTPNNPLQSFPSRGLVSNNRERPTVPVPESSKAPTERKGLVPPVPISPESKAEQSTVGVKEQPAVSIKSRPLPPVTAKMSSPGPAKPPPPPTAPKPIPATRQLGPEGPAVGSSREEVVLNTTPLDKRTVPPLPSQRGPTAVTADDKNTAASRPRDELVIEEPGYDGVNITSPSQTNEKACVISNEDCSTDPLVEEAFCSRSKEECLSIMSTCTDEGVYLIRNSSAEGKPSKTLVVRTLVPHSQVVKYFIVKSQEGSYHLHWKDVTEFHSLGSLLRHYQQNFLPNRTTKLTKPYSKVWHP